jgi:hypothetical protein
METQIDHNFTVQSVQANLDTAISLIPSLPEKTVSQNLSMQYETEKMSFEWRTQNRPLKERILASKEYCVKEYSKAEQIEEGDSSSPSAGSNRKRLFDTKG